MKARTRKNWAGSPSVEGERRLPGPGSLLAVVTVAAVLSMVLSLLLSLMPVVPATAILDRNKEGSSAKADSWLADSADLVGPLMLRVAHAEAQGWDVAGGDGELTYRDDSSDGESVRGAAEEWKKAGVNVREAGPDERPDVNFRDGDPNSPHGGLAHPDGTIELTPGAAHNPRDAKRIATHELGHALGLGHSDDASLMNPARMYEDGITEGPSENDKQTVRELHGGPRNTSDGEGSDPAQNAHDHSEHDHSERDEREAAEDSAKTGEPDDEKTSNGLDTSDEETRRRVEPDPLPDEVEEGSERRSAINGIVTRKSDDGAVEIEKTDDDEDEKDRRGAVRKGDRVIYNGVDAEDLEEGDEVKAGQKVGKVRKGKDRPISNEKALETLDEASEEGKDDEAVQATRKDVETGRTGRAGETREAVEGDDPKSDDTSSKATPKRSVEPATEKSSDERPSKKRSSKGLYEEDRRTDRGADEDDASGKDDSSGKGGSSDKELEGKSDSRSIGSEEEEDDESSSSSRKETSDSGKGKE